MHDLRRTGSTRLHEANFLPDIIETALGHRVAGVRGVYNRARYANQRREMLQWWADWIDELEAGSNVVTLPFRPSKARGVACTGTVIRRCQNQVPLLRTISIASIARGTDRFSRSVGLSSNIARSTDLARHRSPHLQSPKLSKNPSIVRRLIAAIVFL